MHSKSNSLIIRKSIVKQKYDVIISGAGPSGLTAAILCAQNGQSVLVCEKGNKCGPRPRAETVYNHSIFDCVLEKNFIPHIGHYATSKRKYNSPGAKKSFEIEMNPDRTSYVFEWNDLIYALEQKAKSFGVKFLMNTETIAPIIDNDICIGVITKTGHKLFSKTVIACDGHSSNLGKFAGVPYEQMNTFIVKTIVSKCNTDYDGFEYFFIAADEMPKNILLPAVAFIFPRQNKIFETGIYFPPITKKNLTNTASKFDKTKILELWHQLKLCYPRLSDIMKGSKTLYEAVETVPSGMLFDRAAPIPGLILIGDSIGFLEPSGVSGIITSMENARFAVAFINRFGSPPWSMWLAEKYNNEFSQLSIYKYLKRRHRMTALFNSIVFKTLKTAANINKYWWFVKFAYQFK